MNDGSFFFPLLGTGAKKGLSVSTKILSKGILQKVSCKFKLFLKVIIPLAEKKAFNSINLLLKEEESFGIKSFSIYKKFGKNIFK